LLNLRGGRDLSNNCWLCDPETALFGLPEEMENQYGVSGLEERGRSDFGL